MAGPSIANLERSTCLELPHYLPPTVFPPLTSPSQVIYDVQDGVHLINPDQGLPYTDTGFVPPSSTSYTRSASTFAHNPYPCFGAMDKVWPRGFPLNGVTDPESNRCDSVSDESIEKQADGSPRPLGVVQSLVNIEPDVDAMCRLNDLSGHLSFDFAEAPQPLDGAGESPLKIVPPSAFTPYNAQVSRLPVLVWQTWIL